MKKKTASLIAPTSLIASNTTLWSVARAKLGTQASTEQVKMMVKTLAQQNSIAIPEWGIGGSLDSRSLSASVLNSITN